MLPPEKGGAARIRIFTPGRELPFGGHPVLGSAFVVAGALKRPAVQLETGLGLVPVELRHDGERIVFGRMRQPIPSWRPYEHEARLLAALGVERSGLPVEAYQNGPLHVYVETESEQAVAELRPASALYARADGSAEHIERVEVGGSAVIVARGEFLLP